MGRHSDNAKHPSLSSVSLHAGAVKKGPPTRILTFLQYGTSFFLQNPLQGSQFQYFTGKKTAYLALCSQNRLTSSLV